MGLRSRRTNKCTRFTSDGGRCTNRVKGFGDWCGKCLGSGGPNPMLGVGGSEVRRPQAFAPVGSGTQRLAAPPPVRHGSSFAGMVCSFNSALTDFERSSFQRSAIHGLHVSSRFVACDFGYATVQPGTSFIDCRFDQADLGGMNATGVSFRLSDFGSAHLGRGVFRACEFGGADLSKANLSAADFIGSTYDASTVFPPGYSPEMAMWVFEPGGIESPAARSSLTAALIVEEVRAGTFQFDRDRSEVVDALLGRLDPQQRGAPI